MRFDILTLFPSMFAGFLNESILKRAQESGLIEIVVHDIRDWTHDRHRTVDDYPYGGGAGMVMQAPPIVEAVESIMPERDSKSDVILLSPSGELFNQQTAAELSKRRRIVLICGRYEGIDQRAVEILSAREMSIGDYVLTGGELPAAVIVDAVSRLVPDVIDAASSGDESHSRGLLEYPQYTRPFEYRGLTVPDVLLSGHHANVERWRREQALFRTRERRPELLSSECDSGTGRANEKTLRSGETESDDHQEVNDPSADAPYQGNL